MIRLYPALIHKDPDSDYGVSFPDFPGCVSAGSDLEELHRMALEALQFHVDGMVDDGEALPEPLDSAAVQALAAEEEAAGVLFVPARLPGKAKRVNVTIDEFLLGDIDKAAMAQGMSRSAFLAEGARRMLKTG